MKHVKVILIITALLTNHIIYNAENTFAANENTNEAVIESKENVESQEKTEKTSEPSEIEQWNNHLELLKTDDDYWDKEAHTPLSDWKKTAFELAAKVLAKDSTAAETLKTSFLEALNTKTNKFTDIEALVDEFKEFIKEELSKQEVKPVQETKEPEPIPTVEITPPPTTPEPVSESVSTPTETTAPTTTSTTSVSSTESTQPKDLKSEWKTVLESIEQDASIGASLAKAYELTRELLLSGEVNPVQLEKQFNDALTERAIKKQLDPTVVANERAYFKMNIAQQLQPLTSQNIPYPMPQGISLNREQQREWEKQSEFEKLHIEKDLKEKEELEKQLKKKEEDRLILLAATERAEKEKAISEEQRKRTYDLAQLQKERDEEIKKELAKEMQKLKDAQKALSKNIQQMAQAQKTTAEKGMFSAFTEAVGNWWYGENPEQPKGLPSKKEDEFLNTLVAKTKNPEAAKEKFKDFQRILLHFNSPFYWDADKEMPNSIWIEYMQELIKDIVITYEIMSLKQVSTIVEQVLASSPQLTLKPKRISKIITAIGRITKEEENKQKEEQLKEQERKQRIKEKKERLLREQQKIKEEKERRIMQEKQEKERQLAQAKQHQDNIINYKAHKDDWYDILYKVASNQKATAQSNHEHTHQALQKSQAILQLADIIPAKNKVALSQKLKQKFSIALLEQKKRNKHDLNIYHHMDIFNQEINKMIE